MQTAKIPQEVDGIASDQTMFNITGTLESSEVVDTMFYEYSVSILAFRTWNRKAVYKLSLGRRYYGSFIPEDYAKAEEFFWKVAKLYEGI